MGTTSDPGYFKRNFAQFLVNFDEDSYKAHKERKEELFSEIHGTVLELGPGTGANFPFFKDKEITWTGIEPNPAMHKFLFNAAERFGIDINLIGHSSESIDLPDDSVDFVISTEVLCSVNSLVNSLTEIRRVLRKDRKFLFLEHVVDKKNFGRRIVQKIVPFTPWRYYSDGCRPGRDIGKTIKESGFRQVEYADYHRTGDGIIIMINRPHICGWALK